MESTNNFRQIIAKMQEATVQKNTSGVFKADAFISRYRLRLFKEYLAPDSNPYFSALNPMFSFELEYESAMIKSMPIISLRDGVMPLLKFFSMNLIPKNKDQIYIVDDALSCLVPDAWRSQVLLRSLYVDTAKYPYLNKKSDKLILIAPIEEMLPIDLLEKEIKNLFSQVKENDNVLLFFSFAKLRTPGLIKKDESWGYTVLTKFFEMFPKNKIKVLNWNDYLSLDPMTIEYHLINPLKFYLADSFLLHDLNQRGAKPLFGNEFHQDDFYKVGVSANHGFYLHHGFEKYNSFGRENLINQISELQDDYGSKDRKVHSQTFCTDEFNSWAKDVARLIF